MAFKKIERGLLAALQLGKKCKQVVGYLLGVEIPPKAKYEKSRIINLQAEDGTRVNVWSSAQINQQLLTPDGKAIEPAFAGKLIRLTYTGEQRVKGRKQPMKAITVEVDAEKRLPTTGRAYNMDGGKRKFAK